MMRDKPVIAVVGAGRMGIGIAHVFAYSGYRVRLLDARDRSSQETEQVLGSAERQVRETLAMLASLGVMGEDQVNPIMSRIGYFGMAQAQEALKDAGVVFEAVPEVMEIKRGIFGLISSLAEEKALIASTTSTFLSDNLAAFVTSPERFMNTHWLNPAYLIPLVEVSPAEGTGFAEVEAMVSLLEAAGKVPVKCAASPGFIVPRIQALAMNEAARLAEEGVASPEDIDKATRVGFGLRFAVLGLLEFIDWGGGDILYYADNYLKDALKTDRYEPPEIIVSNMESGRTGLRTGKGFYDFTGLDVDSYRRETIKKFADLLTHLGLLARPPQ